MNVCKVVDQKLDGRLVYRTRHTSLYQCCHRDHANRLKKGRQVLKNMQER